MAIPSGQFPMGLTKVVAVHSSSASSLLEMNAQISKEKYFGYRCKDFFIFLCIAFF